MRISISIQCYSLMGFNSRPWFCPSGVLVSVLRSCIVGLEWLSDSCFLNRNCLIKRRWCASNSILFSCKTTLVFLQSHFEVFGKWACDVTLVTFTQYFTAHDKPLRIKECRCNALAVTVLGLRVERQDGLWRQHALFVCKSQGLLNRWVVVDLDCGAFVFREVRVEWHGVLHLTVVDSVGGIFPVMMGILARVRHFEPLGTSDVPFQFLACEGRLKLLTGDPILFIISVWKNGWVGGLSRWSTTGTQLLSDHINRLLRRLDLDF